MSLPNPLPDNPTRWDGWKHYNSPNPYTRLCLSFEDNPTREQIEENCRVLLVWWQKKLPLKNQPSNPIAQMLRGGMDEAPIFLADAKTQLLDVGQREEIDRGLRQQIVLDAINEFKKILPFAIAHHELTPEAEERLYEGGAKLGLLREEMQRILDPELQRMGVKRVVPVIPPPPQAAGAAYVPGDSFAEFRRVLKLSKLCLDGEELTDDQRDALCNMGESLGLTGGQAEDVIDEYLEEVSTLPPPPLAPARGSAPARGGAAVLTPARPAAPPTPARPAPVAKPPAKAPAARVEAPPPVISPMLRLQEQQKYPNFTNRYGLEMRLVTSGQFMMGSEGPEAAPHERPAVLTTVSAFYMSRFPVTNEQFEQFDPAHSSRRAPWANGRHPVVFVNVKEASAYCEWLTARHGHRYRLPTEAEWEYAARGTDNRLYPWGDRLDAGHYANFADASTAFPWRDLRINDGFAETAPVGSFPKGASPFGIEDMAGNIFEWCADYFEMYRGTHRVNPRGPNGGSKRIYRGGSWKSRSSTLRGAARSFNEPDYVSNDVGFRVVCECEGD